MSDLQEFLNSTISVLIVDDNMNNLQVLGSILHENNFNVIVAKDGKSALVNAEHKSPDIVLLDIMMPDMDGYEVCRQLRQKESTRYTPVIFLSAKQETDSIVTGFNVGGNDYLTKPFIKDELLARIKNQIFISQTTRNLKEMIKAKDHFFKVIAHDLKTPVNNQLNFADLLQANIDSYEKDKVKSFVKMIYETAVGQYKLLENLLEWTRLQSGIMVPDKKLTPVFELIDDSLQLHSSIATFKNISISTDGDKDAVIYADSKMIETVFRNILSNAFKFTPENGEITILVAADQDMTTIEISDSGPGMDKNKLDNLFTLRGISYNTETDGQPKSNGLGLLLSKEFLDINNGTITVESEINQGTKFSITLPSKE